MYNMYLNFYSIGALIATAFTLFLSLFLLSIKDKSKASFHLGMVFVAMFFMNSAYMVAGAFYDQWAIYHRWFTVLGSLWGISHATMFFINYPVANEKKWSSILFYAKIAGVAIATIYFAFATFSADTIYHFRGHYWDFEAETLSRNIAIMIVTYILILIGISIYKVIVVEKGQKLTMGTLALSMVVVTVVPGILNTLSRAGLVSRGLFQTAFDLLTILGFFLMIIIYINHTEDKTTFMGKIIGISLVTFLLVMQGISFVSLLDREEAYDAIHKKDTQLALKTGFRSDELEYIVSYDIKEAQTVEVFSRDQIAPDYDIHRITMQNTMIFEKLKNAGEYFVEEAEGIIQKAHPKFDGYARFIKPILFQIKEGQKTRENLFLEIEGLESFLIFTGNRIRKIEDANFRSDLRAFLEQQSDTFAPFQIAISNHLKSSDSEGFKLKEEVLSFMVPFSPAWERQYRYDKVDNQKHYTAFIFADIENEKIYEAGYSYSDYRAYIHQTAFKLAVILATVLFVVLIGFRLFFLGALVNPLQSVVDGLKEVNNGNLDIRVPVKVEDEIGFLAHSFNKVVRSVKAARKRLEQYANELEEKVQERTSELQNSLEQVQELKEKQDGDYFLTSLLIQPLGRNNAVSDNVHVDFHVKQKKDFSFRRWQKEIGGDICIAHSITLHNRKHTVFLNADAMGKSMQGAGGILVLGSVFHNIIERTMIKKSERDTFPERWMKNAFIELHRTFESFDGSMLISIAMGLIDDDTGLMYYINAEHPWSVLLRDGKAHFIEQDLSFRKLGTQGVSSTISVQTEQLREGDILFVGSDGRDDLLIGEDVNGARIINEDEQLFLKHVEKSGGDMNLLVDSILETGELTDDLSLIRVAYKEATVRPGITDEDQHQIKKLKQEAQDLIKTQDWEGARKKLEKVYDLDSYDADALKMIINICIQMRDYYAGAMYVEDYMHLRPSESGVLYYGSYCYKMTRNYERAIDLGERLRLRNPGIVRNLVNLADIYSMNNQPARAKSILQQALEIDPDNEHIRKTYERVEQVLQS